MSDVYATEDWLPVLGWPSYEISSFGRVRRNRKMLSLFPVAGYLAFNVIDRNKRKSLRVHIEVLRVFVSERPEGMNALHKNGIPLDCNLDNLYWGTFADNEANKKRHGRAMNGSRNHQAKLTESQVSEIRQQTGTLKSIGDKYGVSLQTVWYIKHRKTWAHT